MTEFRLGERSDLDAGEVRDNASDAVLDVAMEMAAVVTSTAEEIQGTPIFERTERHENGQWGTCCEAAGSPADWRSRMEWSRRQQAEDLMQLHQAGENFGTLLEAGAAHKVPQ